MYMTLLGEFQVFYFSFFIFFFFYEKILHIKKNIKNKQATFTQIFYTSKKHKKQLFS